MCKEPVRKWHEMSSMESWEGIFELGYEARVGVHQAERPHLGFCVLLTYA